MRVNLIFLATLSLLGSQAMADVICTASTIVGNQEIPFSSMQIPDDSAISSETAHNGYKITVNCDLHSNPNKLSLSIVGPQGATASTSTKNKLKLVDVNGNGASVSCVYQN